MKQILIVEDDLYIGDMLNEALMDNGYEVKRAFSGSEALLFIKDRSPDLVLLDLMLPGLSGEEILSEIKEIPTIIISAKLDIDHKVDLLLEGAVDYITKPFELKELLARIHVALRSNQKLKDKNELEYKDLRLFTDINRAEVGEIPIKLTRVETKILELLLLNPKQVVTKSQILEYIFDEAPECTENSLKTHMSNIRKKLTKTSHPEYIESVWGIGFKLKE